MTRIICLLIPLVLLISTASCTESKTKETNDTAVIAVSSEPKRINPLMVSDNISFSISGLVFRGLTRIDGNMSVKPDLAESWQVKGNGREIIFKLRQDVKWHDGSQFTAHDVVFTYNLAASKGSPSPQADSFGSVRSVNALDSHTLQVIYTKPYGSALESWTMGIMPSHLSQGIDISAGDTDRRHIGTGPYRLVKWIQGQAMYLEAYDGYYHSAPGIKRVIIRFIADPATRMMEMRAGRIDAVELTAQQMAAEAGTGWFKERFNLYKSVSNRWGFLGLNLKDKRFKDIKVRQAISHGIDKYAIIKAVFRGFADISTGPYPPDAWYYNKDAPYFEYDKAKAIGLLTEAGWRKDKEGVLNKEGMTLSFELITSYENSDNIKTAQMIQQDLKAIGVNVSIVSYEWQTFRHWIIEGRNFQAVLLSRAYLNDPDIYPLWHSQEARQGGWNFLSYSSPEVDSLLEKARTESNQAKRRYLYQRIHYLLARDQACVFLYNSGIAYAVNKSIRGVKESPFGIFGNLHEWE